jgi:hypothetical protein
MAVGALGEAASKVLQIKVAIANVQEFVFAHRVRARRKRGTTTQL